MKGNSRIQNTDHQNSSSFSNWFLIIIDSAMPLWNYHQDLSGLTSHSRSGTEPWASSVTILGLTHNQCERWMQKDHLIFLSSASCCFLFILKIIFLCTIESEWMVQILRKIPTKSFRTLNNHHSRKGISRKQEIYYKTYPETEYVPWVTNVCLPNIWINVTWMNK